MKIYKLKSPFKGYEKETKFFLIAESEFIGVKEYVLRTRDLTDRIVVNEKELINHFLEVK
ncbi:hypothetical protein KDN24_16030 [Bacillus sp. Bva_UNVM-123]|uniref:hypothetical protein n=1 Tax=Bacillus sp. Bva_UNVM-123 TaxID=2829798 RepID=UPI00391F0B81